MTGATEQRNGHAEAPRAYEGPEPEAPSATRRLYQRHSAGKLANRPVRRWSDEDQAAPSTSTAETPPSAQAYRAALEPGLRILDGVWPLRAARLRAQLVVLEAAETNFAEARVEEEERLQHHNEDAARADDEIDDRVGKLRERLEETLEPCDEEVGKRRDEYYHARAHAAGALAAAGLRELLGQLPQLDVLPEAVAAAAVASAPLGAFTPAARGLRPLGRALQALWRSSRDRAEAQGYAAQDAVPAPSDAGAEATAPGITHMIRRMPREEGEDRSRTQEAIAFERGTPARLAACAGLRRRSRLVLELVFTLVAGGIFGASIGLLTGSVQLPVLSIERVWLPWTVLLLAGFGMYWAMGAAMQRLACYAAELSAAAALSQGRDQRELLERWQRRRSWCAAALLSCAVAVLVLIDVQVERNGIVQTFAENALNASIAAGRVGGTSGPGNFVYYCLALIASLPYLMLHVVNGVVEGHDRAIEEHLRAAHSAEAHAHAERLLAEREPLYRAFDEANNRGWSVAGDAESPSADARQEEAGTAADKPPADAEAPLETASGQDPPAGEPAARDGDARQPASGAAVARAMAGLELAHIALARLKHAQAERSRKAEWLERRIASLESKRRAERPHLPAASEQRVNEAHAAWVAAGKELDGMVEATRRRYERWARGGCLYWLADIFFRRRARPEPLPRSDGFDRAAARHVGES